MSIKENVLNEALRIEEDTNFSSCGHFITANRWSNYHYALGAPATILAVLSGSSALTPFDSHYVVAGILAILAGVLAGIITFLNPYESASTHLSAGNSYRRLRNDTRIFRELDCLRDSEEDMLEKLKALANRREMLNDSSPQPPQWAYKKAKKAIEKEETTKYAVDKKKGSS